MNARNKPQSRTHAHVTVSVTFDIEQLAPVVVPVVPAPSSASLPAVGTGTLQILPASTSQTDGSTRTTSWSQHSTQSRVGWEE